MRVVLNGVKIGKNCIIGANALVTEGKEIPDNSMVLGFTCQSGENANRWPKGNRFVWVQAHYVENAKRFRDQLVVQIEPSE